MRNILFKLTAIVIAFSFTKTHAQTLKWGELLESRTSVYQPRIFGEDQNAIYVISYERDDIMLERFDKIKWNKTYSVKVSAKSEEFQDENAEGVGYDGDGMALEHVTFLSEQFVVFTSDYDKDNDMYRLYASVYNKNNGELIKENVKIYEVGVEKFNRKGSFGFLASKNRKFMLIYHVAYHKKKKEYEDHTLVINENLEILTDKKEIERRDENTYKTYNYLVDDEGSVYFAKRLNTSETYLVSYDANKDYDKWEEKINLEDVKLDHQLSDITFEINDNNDLLISGYYDYVSDKAKKYPGYVPTDLEGFFFMKVDGRSKEFAINKISPYSQEFYNTFRNEKQIKKDQKVQIPNLFKNTQILSKKDGGTILVGESFSITQVKNGTLFFYSDILIVNFSPEGNIIWERRIKKNQVGSMHFLKSVNRALVQMQYFSYIAGLGKDKLVIIYNENEKNIGKSFMEKYEYCKVHQGVPIIATIDMNSGEIKSEIIEDFKESKLDVMPMESFQSTQESDIILFAQDGKKYKFGILSF